MWGEFRPPSPESSVRIFSNRHRKDTENIREALRLIRADAITSSRQSAVRCRPSSGRAGWQCLDLQSPQRGRMLRPALLLPPMRLLTPRSLPPTSYLILVDRHTWIDEYTGPEGTLTPVSDWLIESPLSLAAGLSARSSLRGPGRSSD